MLAISSGATLALVQVAENKFNAAIPNHQLAGSGTTVQRADIKGPKNILLASLDTRPSWAQSHQASHTDSIIILHVAADHQQAYMLSIPRDLLVDLPRIDNGKHVTPEHRNKINSAFAFGSTGLDGDAAVDNGMAALVKVIHNSFGITPDAEAVVNYDGFKEILGQVGHVCLYVDEDVTSIHVGHTADGKQAVPATTDNNDHVHWIEGVTANHYPKGNQCLDPTQALDFARQRDVLSLGDSDYGRQRHQQQLLKAILKTAVSQGLNSPTKLPGILTAIGKAMTIYRQGISLEDWAFGLRSINPNNIITLKTNNDTHGFCNVAHPPPGVGDSQCLTQQSMQMFKAAKDDTMQTFVQTHSDWVAKT